MDKVAIFDELEKLLSEKAEAAHITDVNKYYVPESIQQKQSFYFRLASSLQNGTSSGMDRSIKFNGENRKLIGEVLCDYNYDMVLNTYCNAESLYHAFSEKIHDKGAEARAERARKASDEKRTKILAQMTNWEKYARGLYQGAEFLQKNPSMIQELCQYNDAEQLDMKDIKAKFNAIDIKGLGTALRCDWLKECGCTWLVKPDVHIKVVYQALKEKETGEELEYSKIKDWDVIEYYFQWVKELQRAGKQISVYQLDKMIWLICTGEFYLDKKETIGRNTIIQRINEVN